MYNLRPIQPIRDQIENWLLSCGIVSNIDFYTLGQIYKHVLKHKNDGLMQTFVCHNVKVESLFMGFSKEDLFFFSK